MSGAVCALVDIAPGTAQRFGDGKAAQFGCGEVGEGAAHLADRGARTGDDVRTWHEDLLRQQ